MQMHLLSERSSVFVQADPYAVSGYVNQHVGSHCTVSYTHLTLPTIYSV